MVLGASTMNTAALLQELQNLEQQLVTIEFKVNKCSFTFNTNLSKGMTSSEVQSLQKVLNYTSLTQVAISGPGSPNNESTYFGSATKNAVIAFQNIFADQILTPNGLTSGNGYVGSATRSVLNSLCSQ
jgi:peptidoglycan hydrolase-like protein with peptidoglycan-binding domain